MTYPVFMTLLSLTAVFLTIGGLLGLFFMATLARRYGSAAVISAFLFLCLIGSSVGIIGSARVYTSDIETSFSEYFTRSIYALWGIRLISLTIVALAVLVIAQNWNKSRERQGGAWLWLTFIAYFLTDYLGYFLGAKPDYSYKPLYVPLMFTAVYLLPAVDLDVLIRWAKRAMLLMLYGSLFMAAIQPSGYVEMNYAGIIPGFHLRLHGILPHANALAPLALFFLLFDYWRPSPKYWRALHVMTALLVLFLTQSKTTWVLAIASVAVIALYRILHRARDDSRKRAISLQGMVGLLLLFAVPVGLMLLALGSQQLQVFYSGLDERAVTLTGRTHIWTTTLEVWKRYPWFGYGPSLWDLDFRVAYGEVAAWHAHNQFLQSMGRAGLVGLAGLLIYVVALVYASYRYSQATKAVLLAVVVSLVLRSITETPFMVSGNIDPSVFIQLLLFACLLALERMRVAQGAQSGPLPVRRRPVSVASAVLMR